MPLRLIEMAIPEDEKEELEKILEDQPTLNVWSDPLSEGRLLIKILLSADKTEGVLDLLEDRFASKTKDFRIVLLPVEAVVPRPEPEKPTPLDEEEEEEPKPDAGRMYREEVYYDILDAIKLNQIWITLVILSSIAAAIGIFYGSIAVIIGAMVIAPLLGPNVALAFATTLGDTDLAKKALKTNAIGLAIALIMPMIFGLVMAGQIEPGQIPEIDSRTEVKLGDLAIALVAGATGGLAFTTGISAALVGVMVAVALLPPLVVCGLLAGSGNLSAALGALLLLVTNLICVNLAGVFTFIAQGIHPNSWWEEKRAKKATRQAVALWVFLFTVLVIAVLISRGYMALPW